MLKDNEIKRNKNKITKMNINQILNELAYILEGVKFFILKLNKR